MCSWLLTDIVEVAGYEIESFGGFHSKRSEDHTHFFAELKKENQDAK